MFSLQHKFYGFLDQDPDDDDEPDVLPEGPPALFKISDADGSLDMESVKEGDISKEDLTSEVFISKFCSHLLTKPRTNLVVLSIESNMYCYILSKHI